MKRTKVAECPSRALLRIALLQSNELLAEHEVGLSLELSASKSGGLIWVSGIGVAKLIGVSIVDDARLVALDGQKFDLADPDGMRAAQTALVAAALQPEKGKV